MIQFNRLLVLALAAAVNLPLNASAADPDEAALEGSLEEDGLQEKQPRATKDAPADPDPPLLD